MIDETIVQNLLSGLLSSKPAERERSADEVTDFVRRLDITQANRIGSGLVHAALVESVDTALEAQLNAVDELTVWHQIDRRDINKLLALDPTLLGPSEQEYLSNLRNYCRLANR